MPKVKPIGDTWDAEFRAEVKYYMALNGIKNSTELARRMCIPQSTLSRHLKNPAIMSVNELRLMTKVLEVPKEEIGRFVRGTKQ